MGYDLVTWVPAIGGAGADQWDPPADKLWAAGPSAGYSATPAISEINAGRDFNQVIALVNRRALRYNACFGTALGTLSYWPVDGSRRINLADLTLIRNAIAAIRAAEGFSVFSWQAITGGTSRDWARYLGELRQALRAAGTATTKVEGFPLGRIAYYEREDNPYGTKLVEQWLSGAGVGQSGSGPWYRYRVLAAFRVPDWVTAVASAYSTMKAPAGADIYELWQSNTDDSAFSSYAVAYHFDLLLGTVAGGSGLTITPAIDPAFVVARAGGRISLLQAAQQERLGVFLASYGLTDVNWSVSLDFGS